MKEFIWTQKRQNNEMEVKSDECVAVDESEISESYADQFETAYDVIINWTTSSKDHKVCFLVVWARIFLCTWWLTR